MYKPCRSPYCECKRDACTHPGFYDSRHIPVTTGITISATEARILVRCMAGAYDVRYLRAEEKELYLRLLEIAHLPQLELSHG